MRGGVLRIACDCPLIGFDRGSKLTCGLQRDAEIHVSWGEALVRLDSFAEASKRFCCGAGCLRGNAAVYKLLCQPAVAAGHRHFGAAAPQQIPE